MKATSGHMSHQVHEHIPQELLHCSLHSLRGAVSSGPQTLHPQICFLIKLFSSKLHPFTILP